MRRANRRPFHAGLAVVAFGAALMTVASADAAAAENQAAGGVEDVVLLMNRAVTERDLRAILAQFAAGAVQVNLNAAHAGATDETETIVDLAGQWKAIAPIIFANTESYIRSVEEMATHVDGELASVWARIRTETRRPAVQGAVTVTFFESYLLALIDGDWKILSVANNRPTR